MFHRFYSRSCSPLLEAPAILRLKRQQHPRDLLPKTFFVSSQLKYVAAIDSQLRKGAWLQRSFTLSPVRQGTNPPWWVAPKRTKTDQLSLLRLTSDFRPQTSHI